VVYFTRNENRVVSEHLKRGGRAVLVRGGQVVFAQGGTEEALQALDRVPMTHGGRAGFQVENALAAAAAAWSLGLPSETIRAGLETFTGDSGQAPGRFNVFESRGATVVVDYAHNPSALAALVEALSAFPHERRCLVFAASNRRDVDVLEMGRIVGGCFDRVVLYRDRGNSDRSDGELNALLVRGMHRGRAEVVEAEGEREAIGSALAGLRPGDVLVLGIEDIEGSLAWLGPVLASEG
jgi:cyanophycin synthetase